MGISSLQWIEPEAIPVVKLNYYFNINDKMKQHFKKQAQTAQPNFKISSDFQKLYDKGNLIGFQAQVPPYTQSPPLPDFALQLPGYTFAGWKLVSNRHYLLPHKGSKEQAALYAGERSIIHQTGVSDYNFLWPAGQHFTPEEATYDFYAQWIPIAYEVQYGARTIFGMELPWSAPSGQRTIEKGYYSRANPELRGYEFMGWSVISDNKTLTNTQLHPAIPAGIGDIKLIAIFDEMM